MWVGSIRFFSSQAYSLDCIRRSMGGGKVDILSRKRLTCSCKAQLSNLAVSVISSLSASETSLLQRSRILSSKRFTANPAGINSYEKHETSAPGVVCWLWGNLNKRAAGCNPVSSVGFEIAATVRSVSQALEHILGQHPGQDPRPRVSYRHGYPSSNAVRAFVSSDAVP